MTSGPGVMGGGVGVLKGNAVDESFLRGTKIQLAVNNLANNHNITGITPFVAATPTAHFVPNANDLIQLLPGRSITITITGGYAPKR